MLFGDEHVKRYEETDGAEGHEWQGTTTLILTTTGRKSGQQRRHPLIYQKHGQDYLVVASKGGADEPPAWYLNLVAHPDVQVQVQGSKFAARARTATPEEKPGMWREMTAVWPATTITRRRPAGDPRRGARAGLLTAAPADPVTPNGPRAATPTGRQRPPLSPPWSPRPG